MQRIIENIEIKFLFADFLLFFRQPDVVCVQVTIETFDTLRSAFICVGIGRTVCIRFAVKQVPMFQS